MNKASTDKKIQVPVLGGMLMLDWQGYFITKLLLKLGG